MLTTIDKVKEFIGGADDKDDARITSCLTRASAYIERYTGRTFISTAYVNESYDGTGIDTLMLRNFPLISVQSVLEGGANGTSLSIGTDASTGVQVIWDADTGKLIRPFYRFLKVYRGFYLVSYTAGYAAIPDDIIDAAIELTLLMLNEKNRVGLVQHGTGGVQSTYTRKLPDWAAASLDSYRDFALGRPA